MDIKKFGICIAGAAAGVISGLFGAGGGMVLVPLLSVLTDVEECEIFPCSISIILPICMACLCFSGLKWEHLRTAYPYLFGSGIGGILAGLFGQKIPTLWLHRLLGVLILWGGIRNLC